MPRPASRRTTTPAVPPVLQTRSPRAPRAGDQVDVAWDDRDQVFRGRLERRISRRPGRNALPFEFEVLYDDGDTVIHDMDTMRWRYANSRRWYLPGDLSDVRTVTPISPHLPRTTQNQNNNTTFNGHVNPINMNTYIHIPIPKKAKSKKKAAAVTAKQSQRSGDGSNLRSQKRVDINDQIDVKIGNSSELPKGCNPRRAVKKIPLEQEEDDICDDVDLFNKDDEQHDADGENADYDHSIEHVKDNGMDADNDDAFAKAEQNTNGNGSLSVEDVAVTVNSNERIGLPAQNHSDAGGVGKRDMCMPSPSDSIIDHTAAGSDVNSHKNDVIDVKEDDIHTCTDLLTYVPPALDRCDHSINENINTGPNLNANAHGDMLPQDAKRTKQSKCEHSVTTSEDVVKYDALAQPGESNDTDAGHIAACTTEELAEIDGASTATMETSAAMLLSKTPVMGGEDLTAATALVARYLKRRRLTSKMELPLLPVDDMLSEEGGLEHEKMTVVGSAVTTPSGSPSYLVSTLDNQQEMNKKESNWSDTWNMLRDSQIPLRKRVNASRAHGDDDAEQT